jgi:lysophospholipase L1-like esterase
MIKSDFDRGIINIGNMYRFHRVFKKLENKENVTIVFLGGSITQDCHATVHELCYAYRVFDWFKQKFPAAEIKYVNAGIGATTSQLGVSRVDEDVLNFEPDVVFVEFSVNDSNNKKFQETYEGLLRKIIFSKTEPAVFTFNNVQYDDGVNAQEVHNAIGRYYNLPIVSMKDSIYQEILKGNFTSKDVSTDNLHPNNTGHGLLSSVIINLLELIFDQYNNGNVESEKAVYPEAPLTSNKYAASKRIRNEVARCDDFKSEFVTVDEREQAGPRDCFKKGIIFNQAGAYIQTKLDFRGLSVQFCKAPDKNSPICGLYIDGERAAILDGNFEEKWGDCLYLQDICYNSEKASHEVKIIVEDYPENCLQNFYFVSFIIY